MFSCTFVPDAFLFISAFCTEKERKRDDGRSENLEGSGHRIHITDKGNIMVDPTNLIRNFGVLCGKVKKKRRWNVRKFGVASNDRSLFDEKNFFVTPAISQKISDKSKCSKSV